MIIIHKSKNISNIKILVVELHNILQRWCLDKISYTLPKMVIICVVICEIWQKRPHKSLYKSYFVWLPWQQVWSANNYTCQKYNLDIRLSFYNALKRRMSELWFLHIIWKSYLKWYTSALGMEYLNARYHKNWLFVSQHRNGTCNWRFSSKDETTCICCMDLTSNMWLSVDVLAN